jgi:N utilization substance protein B
MTDSNKSDKPRRSARRPRTSARLAAVQALYQMEITGAEVSVVVAEFRSHRLVKFDADASFGPADPDFFEDILAETSIDLERLDGMISGSLMTGWALDRLETLVRAILRAATHELVARPEIPSTVVISEYVDVTHAFFVDKEPGFVNGVLNKIARDCRPADEFSPPSPAAKPS